MTEITIRNIIEACHGTWQGNDDLLDCCPENVVTDSRQAGENSLFLALRGERTDGHRFIPDVLSKGALAVLCEECGTPGDPRIIVPDVLAAMRQIALWNRERFSCPFIGVTGSVGKTTTKEMIAAVLSAHFNTFKTPGNLNGQIGLPVTLMSLSTGYEAAVIEMGISLFGEMERITKVVRPDMAVFTNIGDAHLEFLHDRQGVLRAKSEILLGMDKDAVVIANGDDDLLSKADFGRRTVLYGLGDNCDVRAEEIRNTDGMSLSCRIVTKERSFPVYAPAYGRYMIYAVLAAAAVGLELGLTDQEIARGMERYNTVGHRSRVIKTSFCTLIDDCYNANPTSNRGAIDSMAELPGRKVCILGDMRELGERSNELHREIGSYAIEHGMNLILTQGEKARYIAQAAGDKAINYPDRASLLAALPKVVRPGDVILVKASLGARFMDVAETVKKLK